LLVDEWRRVETRAGSVDLIGADWRMSEREEHLTQLFADLGQRDQTPRILMLHDPGAFKYVPPGAADLTLAGHTHGGHVGLLSLGLNWTMIGAFGSMPDHGLWAKGANRLYVHRGTGHYGFPVRIGVPGEEGMLEVEFG
jgi:predicted MPP superfamily phosphohydrolase